MDFNEISLIYNKVLKNQLKKSIVLTISKLSGKNLRQKNSFNRNCVKFVHGDKSLYYKLYINKFIINPCAFMAAFRR